MTTIRLHQHSRTAPQWRQEDGSSVPAICRRWASRHGAAGWLRMDGRYTLYYRDSGKVRQRTWQDVRVAQRAAEDAWERTHTYDD